MTELRHDPIQRRWVIIATDRSKPPHRLPFRRPAEMGGGGFCPFCNGHEDKTPPEIFALRRNGGVRERPRLGRARHPQQVPRPDDRGRPRQEGGRDLRPDARRRRPRGLRDAGSRDGSPTDPSSCSRRIVGRSIAKSGSAMTSVGRRRRASGRRSRPPSCQAALDHQGGELVGDDAHVQPGPFATPPLRRSAKISGGVFVLVPVQKGQKPRRPSRAVPEGSRWGACSDPWR